MRASLLVLTLAACASNPPAVRLSPAPPGQPPETRMVAQEFARFVDEYFAAQFAWSPTFATREGLHEYDSRLEDRSRARIDARIAEQHAFAARLAAFDEKQLSFDDAIDAQAIAADIAGDLLQLEVVRSWQHNPMSYAGLPGRAVDAIMKRAYAPGAQRLAAVVARLRQVPAIYAAARANLEEPPRELTEVALRMARGSLRFFETAAPAWARSVAGDDAALLAEFERANAAALAAARDFAGWLETDLLPRSTGKFALGAEVFRAMLRHQEMVDTALGELLAAGEAQLAKDYAALLETARRIDPGKTPRQVMDGLADDHPSEADLIPQAARSLEEVRRFVVARDLITIPSEVRPVVAETPPYARSGSFASMDTPGPFEEHATEAYFYVTPVEKDWDAKHKEEHLRFYNRAAQALVDIHEAFPGHYVQFLYSPRFPSKTRKLLGAGTNSEGWAHYAEEMVVDEGFGDRDPRFRLAQLSLALLRDCRYLTAIRLHTQGMSVEEGARCFVDKAFQEPANAYEEARRGAFNPMYLHYTLGKLQILKLRDEYRARTGASLKQFHDAFVAQGALPVPLVRRLLLERPSGGK